MDGPSAANSGATLDQPPRKKRWREKLAAHWHEVNVEPVIILTAISFGLFGTILPLFLYWARCIEMYKSDPNVTDVVVFCANLSSERHHHHLMTDGDLNAEDRVQIDVATLVMWVRICRCVPGVLASVLLGAWSDGSGGRKKTLLISFIGPNVANILLLVCTIVYRRTSIYALVIIEEAVAGLTGAGITEFAIQMAMVTDRARDKDESSISFRVSIATGLSAVGHLIGALATSWFSGLFSRQMSYFYAVLFCTIAYFIAAVYSKVIVVETFVGTESASVEATPAADTGGVCSFFRQSLALCRQRMAEVKDTLTAPRIGHTRLCLNVTIVLGWYFDIRCLNAQCSSNCWRSTTASFCSM